MFRCVGWAAVSANGFNCCKRIVFFRNLKKKYMNYFLNANANYVKSKGYEVQGVPTSFRQKFSKKSLNVAYELLFERKHKLREIEGV